MYRLMIFCLVPIPPGGVCADCLEGVVRAEILAVRRVGISPYAVAAAQLAPIASCADVKKPDRVPVIPPPEVLVLCWCGLLLLLLLRLCLLDPVGDDLSLLFPGRLRTSSMNACSLCVSLRPSRPSRPRTLCLCSSAHVEASTSRDWVRSIRSSVSRDCFSRTNRARRTSGSCPE